MMPALVNNFFIKAIDFFCIYGILEIGKGATDRRSAPETHCYKEVTACFVRTGRLLLCVYKLDNQLYNYAN